MSAATEIELLTLDELADKLRLGASTVARWRAQGRIPEPLMIGPRKPRWRAAEIESWLAAGCPSRAEWEAIKQGGQPCPADARH